MKVSWQVMATRNDLSVQKVGAPFEIARTDDQRGKYLWPELYNMPASKGLAQVDRPKSNDNTQR